MPASKRGKNNPDNAAIPDGFKRGAVELRVEHDAEAREEVTAALIR
jgi:hypothetical protein